MGMSLRDWFAGQAIAGMMSKEPWPGAENCAKAAYHVADAMLEARKRDEAIYRTVPLPKTQDVIAWDRLPDWVECVARDNDGWVWCYRLEPEACTGVWSSPTEMQRRIDDFPGIVQIGTCDWRDSKQRRPK
jgi:hypothetical protein